MARREDRIRLSSKGQIVLPAGLRRRFSLTTGQSLRVRTTRRGDIVLSPSESRPAEVDSMLNRARDWVAKSGRDLVAELHRRREAERRLGRRRS